jgi:predicted  nucleic acid-binding Zn-ribbon protein
MVSIDEYRKLKTKVEERKAKASRAEGAYDEAMKRLKAAGCDSIEDAEKKLAELKAEEAEAEQAYEEELACFKQKWEGKLG